MSAMAARAEETILLISRWDGVEEKARRSGELEDGEREVRCRAVRRAVRVRWWEGIVAVAVGF
jgi:hypothetical protein